MVKYRTRFGCTLDNKTYDTLLRVSAETMIDRTKIVNKAIDDYLISKGYELRENTEEEKKIYKNK